VNTKAKNTDNDVAGVVDKVEVDKYVVPTLCECTNITHDTHGE